MKKWFTVIILVFSPIFLLAQEYWQARISNKALGEAKYELNLLGLTKKIQKKAEVAIPNSKGRLATFKIYEDSNFEPELAKKYPQIKSYVGYGSEGELRLSVSPNKVEGVILKKNGDVETLSKDNHELYVVRKKEDKSLLNCLEPFNAKTLKNKLHVEKSDGKLRTYRIAISTTGEYAQYFGGTKADALAAINASLTNVNAVLERELSVHLNLVANEDKIIFLNPDTDPYSNVDQVTQNELIWSNELQQTLTNIIGEENYDIGHLLSSDGGFGFAGGIGTVCIDNEKGKGFSAPSDGNPKGLSFDVDFLTHEIGHQLGATHIFSRSELTGTNVEPGSGSTIMGYAGIVAEPYNVQSHSNSYFNLVNILQINNTLRSKTCGKVEDTPNAPVNITLNKDVYVIPAKTPFALEGAVSGTNSNKLTYAWEQIDDSKTGDYSLVNSNIVTGPLFRSYSPSKTPKRVFPSMENILKDNYFDRFEALPNVARELNFGFIVRDGETYGQSSIAKTRVEVLSSDTGFSIKEPNGVQTVTMGSALKIKWNVANTNQPPINVSKVNIYLINNDNKDILLAKNVQNNGFYEVNLPNDYKEKEARIKIEAVGNIFFAVSKPFSVGYIANNVCKEYTSNVSLPIDIPDGRSTAALFYGDPVFLRFNVPTSGKINSVSLKLNIEHENSSDLGIALKSPQDKVIYLFNNQCQETNGKKINGLITDDALPLNCSDNSQTDFKPIQSLNELKNTEQKGNWLLTIADGWGGDTGKIKEAKLKVCVTDYYDDASGTLNSEKHQIKVFPNPAKDYLKVYFNYLVNSKQNFAIYNLVGQVVKKLEGDNPSSIQEISIADLAKGIYILRVEGPGKECSTKFIKE